MDHVRELALRVQLASYVGERAPSWLLRRLGEGLGGVCLYGDNVREPGLVSAATAAVHDARPLALTALDEEGGDVTRLHYRTGSPHAGHAVLGEVDDEELTSLVAAEIGRDLLEHGVDLDLGPVADVNSNPANPVIGVRSFGSDPALCARHTSAWVRGLQGAGAGACLKHFPGHGDTASDSHLELPVVNAPFDVLRGRELVPFAAGVAAGAVAVMTSHVVVRAVDPVRPATFSPQATRLLRRDLGFDGLLVSDALDMRGASAGRGVPQAAVLALVAGVDLLCLGPRLDEQDLEAVVWAVVQAVDDGTLPRERLQDAAARVDAAAAAMSTLRAQNASTSAMPGASVQAARRGVRVAGALRPLAGAQVLRLDAGSNQAVGAAPWGLPADGRVRSGGACVDVHPGDRPWEHLDSRPIVALVRDALHHGWVRETIQRLVITRPDTVLVEMGWPVPWDGALPAATVHTLGASAVSGWALDALLAEGA